MESEDEEKEIKSRHVVAVAHNWHRTKLVRPGSTAQVADRVMSRIDIQYHHPLRESSARLLPESLILNTADRCAVIGPI